MSLEVLGDCHSFCHSGKNKNKKQTAVTDTCGRIHHIIKASTGMRKEDFNFKASKGGLARSCPKQNSKQLNKLLLTAEVGLILSVTAI